MSVMFYQNGAAIGGDAGWGGFTGNNNYVVRYEFKTGASGASQVAIGLSNIFYGHYAGTQSFGFKISANPAEWCNARGVSPDSGKAAMTYSASSGYGCVLSATSLQLLPNTTYYLFVYLASAGAEYYTGWNCVNPQIVCAGSYTRQASSVNYLSPSVQTLGALSLTMNRVGNNYHKASFKFGDETLAVSDAFASSLSYTCPRDWLSRDITSKSVNITVSVQSYSDAYCINPVSSPVTGSFTLTADKDMRPVFYREAVTVTAVNSNPEMSQFVTGISRARVRFDEGLIDMTACGGAEIGEYKISCGGKEVSSASPTLLSDVIGADGALICTVTDTRGISHSITVNLTAYPYVAPSLTSIAASRCASDGKEAEDGAFYKVRFSAACSDISGNACSVSAAVCPAGGSYGEDTALDGFENGVWSDGWASPAILGGSLSGDSFTVRLTVKDTVGGGATYTVPLYRLRWAMKFNETGTAVAFGMEPTERNALQIPDHWRMRCGVPALSPLAYGTASPDEAVSDPVDGQIYLRIQA